ncbi:MAG TPA: hypothetical protein RMF84_07305 [Polyangiaceae bacterium LLY-WYZ-14_1]|nr:hypothetical protein [Polyangiaceae bacterium LLY-WYZ-14_1]
MTRTGIYREMGTGGGAPEAVRAWRIQDHDFGSVDGIRAHRETPESQGKPMLTELIESGPLLLPLPMAPEDAAERLDSLGGHPPGDREGATAAFAPRVALAWAPEGTILLLGLPGEPRRPPVGQAVWYLFCASGLALMGVEATYGPWALLGSLGLGATGVHHLVRAVRWLPRRNRLFRMRERLALSLGGRAPGPTVRIKARPARVAAADPNDGTALDGDGEERSMGESVQCSDVRDDPETTRDGSPRFLVRRAP